MQAYVARRLLLFIPTLFGASLMIFVLMRMVPGDIAQILVYHTGFAAFGKGNFTLITSQDRAMDSTDPGDPFALIWTTQGGSNYGKWSDPKFDELADRALKETDKAKRAKLYHDAQRMFLSGAPSAIPVGWVEGWFFVDKRVRGYKHAPTAYDNITFMKVWLAP